MTNQLKYTRLYCPYSSAGLHWVRHGRCARVLTGGLEIRVPDGAGARLLADLGGNPVHG
jgi:hypothetical protein